MPTRAFRALAVVLLALALQATPSAHDIPDEIAVQTYVRPQQNQLQVLLRVPLLALTDANLPKDGVGYLAMAYLDPALREAANQISNGIVFMEGDQRLTRYELANARISIASDRSFDSYEGALNRVRGEKLPDSTQMYYNQGFLDLEINYPIQSETSRFSMRVLFGQGLASRTATYINFIRPDGDVRAFRIHDGTPLVNLDPLAHQAAWVFLKAGFYRLVDSLDHLLFILALAIPYRRPRRLVAPFAAFTAAYSIALATAVTSLSPATSPGMAAASGWTGGAWFAPAVGALIAFSLVYVSLENGLGKGLRHRWILALVFGVFHGIGFAIALQETLQFAGAHPVAAVAAYNTGLVLAMLLVLAIVVPLANLLFTRALPERAGIIVISVLAGHAGWHWMTDRFTVARLAGWPVMNLPLLLTVVRWLLVLTVIAGVVWLVSGLLRKKPLDAAA